MHGTGTKSIVRHMQKSVVQWSVISKFTCNISDTKLSRAGLDIQFFSIRFIDIFFFDFDSILDSCIVVT